MAYPWGRGVVGDSSLACTLSPAVLPSDESIHPYHKKMNSKSVRHKFSTLDPAKSVLIQLASTPVRGAISEIVQ